MRAYTPDQFAEYLLEDPSADLTSLHDLRRRAREGRLRIVPTAPWSPPREREVQLVGETPVEGPDAVARWVALLDRAEQLQQEGPSDHPTVQRQIARAIDSLFLYEHQMQPAARREAREYVWQRDRTEPLPPPPVRAEWRRCRCRHCQLTRLIQRPAVVKQLPAAPTSDPEGTAPGTSAPAAVSTPARSLQTRQRHASCPEKRRPLLSPDMAQAS